MFCDFEDFMGYVLGALLGAVALFLVIGAICLSFIAIHDTYIYLNKPTCQTPTMYVMTTETTTTTQDN